MNHLKRYINVFELGRDSIYWFPFLPSDMPYISHLSDWSVFFFFLSYFILKKFVHDIFVILGHSLIKNMFLLITFSFDETVATVKLQLLTSSQ